MELSVFLNEDNNKEAPDGYAVVTTRSWADYAVDDVEGDYINFCHIDYPLDQILRLKLGDDVSSQL